MKNTGFQKERRSHTVLTVVFAIIAVAYLYPIFIVLVNSLKTNAAINLDTFAFPTSDTFMGLQNYIKGMTFGNYPFYKSVEYSLMITLLSAALILHLHVHGRVVYFPCRQPRLPHCVLPVRVLHGRPVPDGHVHAGKDRRYSEAQSPVDNSHCLPRLWCGPRCVYVHRLCQVHPALH